MSDLQVTGTKDRLEIVSPMPAGRRIFFGAAALIPLLAPYELILSVRWTTWLHPFFFLAALISLGALAVTGLLLFAALAGLESRMTFDRENGRFTYWQRALVVPPSTRELPFEEIQGVTVETHDWSDGAPSYSLNVAATGGRRFTTASSSARQDIEELRERAIRLLSEERRSLHP